MALRHPVFGVALSKVVILLEYLSVEIYDLTDRLYVNILYCQVKKILYVGANRSYLIFHQEGGGYFIASGGHVKRFYQVHHFNVK